MNKTSAQYPGLPSRWVVTKPLSFSISLLRKGISQQTSWLGKSMGWCSASLVLNFTSLRLWLAIYCFSESGKGIVEASYRQHKAISNLQLNKDSHIVCVIKVLVKDLEGDFQAATAIRCDLRVGEDFQGQTRSCLEKSLSNDSFSIEFIEFLKTS